MSSQEPSITAILLLYDCERFASAAVASVLGQDHRSLDILISDDASTDATFDVAQRQVADYSGPHRVNLVRRSTNSGSKTGHLNGIFPNVDSDVLIFFDGDDVSVSDRATRIGRAFAENPEVHAVYSNMSLIDKEGRPLAGAKVPHPRSGIDTRAWFASVDAYGAGSTLAIRRSVIDTFGSVDPRLNEDVVLPFRASLLGEVKYLDLPLVKARRHASSLTADLERFESLESFRARMFSGIANARIKAESRFADIEAAAARMPERAEEMRALRSIVVSSLADAELTGGLLSPSPKARLRTLAGLVQTGAYRDELARHAAIAFFPSLYLRYKRYWLNRRVR